MYREFLESKLHPTRVSSLVHAIEMLDDLGVGEIVPAIEREIMAGAVGGDDGILGVIEDLVGQVITDCFTQFGVTIEYDGQSIDEQVDFLWFLASWGTSRGPVPSEVLNIDSVYTLGDTPFNILHEFYLLVQGDDETQLEWVEDVSPYLIRAIEGTLGKGADELDEEVAFIPTSALNPLRAFAAMNPEAIGVKHMNAVGNFTESLQNLFAAYAEQVEAIPNVNEQSVHYASLGIVSATPRSQLLADITQELIKAAGETTRTQQLIKHVENIYRELGVI